MFKKLSVIYLVSQCFFSLCMEDMAPDFNKLQGSKTTKINIRKDAYSLHDAAKKGYLDQIQEILNSKPQAIDDLDNKGNTALYYACLFREYDIIRFLINHGANKADIIKAKFLALPPYKEVVNLLQLKQIGDIAFFNILNGLLKKYLDQKKVFSAYRLMAKYQGLGKDQKVNWDVRDEYGKNILFYAVENQKINLIKKCINLGLNVNNVDKDEKPLIVYAVETGNVEVVNLLGLRRANLGILYKNLNLLDFVGDKLSNPEMIEFLINNNCEPDQQILFSCLLEVPIVVYRSILKSQCDHLLKANKKQIDPDKLQEFLTHQSDVIDQVIAYYIIENNNSAVKTLLFLSNMKYHFNNKVKESESDIIKFINIFFHINNHDNPEMLKVLIEFCNIEKSEALFIQLFEESIKRKKWKCGIAIRLLADQLKIDIENYVKELYLTFNNLSSQLEEHRQARLVLKEQLIASQFLENRSGLQILSNKEKQSAREGRATIKMIIRQLKADLNDENKENMPYLCRDLNILKDKYFDTNKVPENNGSQFSCMTEGIDSNDPQSFLGYIYQDQSNGRGDFIAIKPKILDLVYALSINPDLEVAKFKIKDSSYTREKYINNLCDIINTMLMISSELIQELFDKAMIDKRTGQSIIHIATYYSCPEILEHLLKKILENNNKSLVTMLNLKDRKKQPMTPLEIALMLGSEEKVNILVFYGANITTIDFSKLDMKNISPDKEMIKLIIQNHDILPLLKDRLTSKHTAGLSVNELELLINNSIMAREKAIGEENARRLREQEERDRQRIEQARLDYERTMRQAERDHERAIESERIEQQRRAQFRSNKIKTERMLIFGGLGIAALIAYKLFVSKNISLAEMLKIDNKVL